MELARALSGSAPRLRVVALGEVDGMPHLAHSALPQQFSRLAILETCLSVRVGRPPLLRWVGILGSVVWLGDLLPSARVREGRVARASETSAHAYRRSACRSLREDLPSWRRHGGLGYP
jgi:hypothetical protein